MANKYWLGTSGTNFNTAADWSPSGVPADGDTIVLCHLAQNDLDTNLTQAAKTFALIVEDSFTRLFGGPGNPATPDGWTTVIVGGRSQGIYLHGGAADNLDHLIVQMNSTKDEALHITGGTVTKITHRMGNAVIDSGVTVDGDITILGTNIGQPGQDTSKLTISSGCTLTGLRVTQKGGLFDFSTTVPTYYGVGGRAIINGSAGVSTLLNCTGAEVIWDANSSTIALAEVSGGILKTRRNQSGRTLTAAYMDDDGRIDFGIGGLNITYTGGIVVRGNHQPVFPKGSVISVAIA